MPVIHGIPASLLPELSTTIPSLSKIHIAAHIGNVAHNALVINNDLCLKGAMEYDLIVLYKRDLSVRLKPVLYIGDG